MSELKRSLFGSRAFGRSRNEPHDEALAESSHDESGDEEGSHGFGTRQRIAYPTWKNAIGQTNFVKEESPTTKAKVQSGGFAHAFDAWQRRLRAGRDLGSDERFDRPPT